MNIINYRDLNTLNKKPFYIFEIKDFFSNSFYKKLRSELPSLEDLDSNNLKIYNSKYYFSSDDDYYKKIKNEIESINMLDKEIFSERFINYFFNNFFIPIVSSRKFDLKSLIYLFYSKYINKKKLKPIIEFSYILNGGKVVPHTDNRGKLISMLTYFPEDKDSDLENIIGTEFWDYKKNNYSNTHLKDIKLEKEFRKKAKLIYKTPFKGRYLYGFIKSTNSWHSVDILNIKQNYVRKSVNVFLSLDLS